MTSVLPHICDFLLYFCNIIHQFQCCRNTLLNKIIGSHHDIIGIVFFGTKKSNNSLGVDCISTFQDLMQPSAERIKEVDAILEGNYQVFLAGRAKNLNNLYFKIIVLLHTSSFPLMYVIFSSVHFWNLINFIC